MGNVYDIFLKNILFVNGFVLVAFYIYPILNS